MLEKTLIPSSKILKTLAKIRSWFSKPVKTSSLFLESEKVLFPSIYSALQLMYQYFVRLAAV